MNSLHATPACRLAFGVSRLSLRHMQIYHHHRRLATTAAAPPPTVQSKTAEVAATTEEKEKTREEKLAEQGYTHGHTPYHGERIWIHHHTYEGRILYSFTRTIDVNKAYRQMPYTGKKNVPAKLRKDYWEPMAVIDFGPGLGEVGRSVFQKLREFKKRHELEWGRDNPEEEYKLLHMTKHERGQELNNQRPNAVADVASVLSGVGKGSKMWMLDWKDLKDMMIITIQDQQSRRKIGSARLAEKSETTEKNFQRLQKWGVTVREAAGKQFVDWQVLKDLLYLAVGIKRVPHVPTAYELLLEKRKQARIARQIEEAKAAGVEVVEKEVKEEGKVKGKAEFDNVPDKDVTFNLDELKKLHNATIYWAKAEDIRFAETWTDNVEHVVGLPHMTKADSARYWKGREEPRDPRTLSIAVEPAEQEPALPVAA
ncbi:transcriptional regulation of mitochondrial recombination-domain-containing protein [Podospora aff. communis PSN243]|uniref:Large ribosomal subunit protein mL67 n=1 Tax=Podospora aff. communis PSN243 TaxID=3040156 RepID=A0AAV9GJB4_9PEZI|nr:transcriptional regulation of mitochondrial recombination-domain-containing protein [Podospora aff. communis PSN243]